MSRRSPKLQKKVDAFRADLLASKHGHRLSEDRWGHLKLEGLTGNIYRFKFQRNTWRFEVKNGSVWQLITGASFSDERGIKNALSHLNNR